MMTQEEYMDVLAMKRQGMSFKEIGEELGYHPATISRVGTQGRAAAGPHGRRGRSGDRCGVGGPADRVVGREPEAVGEVVVRDRRGGGVHRVVSVGGALGS